MKYFIANWKANFTIGDATRWIDEFLSFDLSLLQNKEIIICAPYHVLSLLNQKVPSYVKLGAQTISEYDSGAFTGEITASMIHDLVSYSLIGHSERRNYFHEDEIILGKKCEYSFKYNIEPIYCVRNEKDIVPEHISFVAYEPIEAIGSGENQPIQEVLNMKQKLALMSSTKFIYGGSVNENNIHEYADSVEIDGLLIGGASLNPLHFYQIITTHTE